MPAHRRIRRIGLGVAEARQPIQTHALKARRAEWLVFQQLVDPKRGRHAPRRRRPQGRCAVDQVVVPPPGRVARRERPSPDDRDGPRAGVAQTAWHSAGRDRTTRRRAGARATRHRPASRSSSAASTAPESCGGISPDTSRPCACTICAQGRPHRRALLARDRFEHVRRGIRPRLVRALWLPRLGALLENMHMRRGTDHARAPRSTGRSSHTRRRRLRADCRSGRLRIRRCRCAGPPDARGG